MARRGRTDCGRACHFARGPPGPFVLPAQKGAATPTHTETKLQVIVHYVAAEHPFKDDAEPGETVGQLKARVLSAFGLSEGQDGGGNVVSYTLYHGKAPLEGPGQALGEVAGHAHALSRKLEQQITQGAAA